MKGTEAKVKGMGTVRRKGLTEDEAAASREQNGANRLTPERKRGFLRHFFSNLGDPVTRILLVALSVNLMTVFWGGDWVETLGIGASVFLAALISTLSERGSEAAFRRLEGTCGRSQVRVYRNGSLKLLPTEELVVGDWILTSAGEQIPADGWVRSGSLRVDQSAMTGENREVEKRPRNGGEGRTPHDSEAVFRGCTVLSGEGEVEIFAVGDRSFLGRICREVQQKTRESPLKVRLTKLARQISYLGYAAAALIALADLFCALVLDSGFHGALILRKLGDLPYLLDHLLHALMLALTVIVVAVPEGLPMMIAVVLSSNIRRMVRDQVLVRKPVGIEAAGSMDLLFTDKTGTLTCGSMAVGAILLAQGEEISSYGRLRRTAPPIAERYERLCRYNSSARWSDGRAVGGNATDRALLTSLGGIGGQEEQILEWLPFDSARKYAAVRLREETWIKGAPERLLPFLRYAYTKEGSRIPFSSVSASLRQRVHEMTSAGGRVLFLAEGERMPREGDLGALTFLCAVLLKDPIRAEARESVRELREAGIGVVMITGDSRETARSIAAECGILYGERNWVAESRELAAMNDGQIRERLSRLAVVARALPEDKSRLVRLAQEENRVVGMTGDGINDAPALKRADVGFAMGSGTDVAKEAGDVIILDDNLSSIAKAVLYGRTVFKSIRKFITLQLTMNLGAMGVSMLGPFLGVDAPVTVVQMLWINMIMDTLGGLAFAGEYPLRSYMKEKPKRRDEPILNGYMIHQILFLGLFTVALCLSFLKLPFFTVHFRATEGRLCLLTAFFALFIFTSVLHCFNARTDRLNPFAGLFRNRAFLLIMTAVCLVQLLFVYLGGEVLRTMPLLWKELRFTLSVSLIVVPAELLRKILWRLLGGRGGY